MSSNASPNTAEASRVDRVQLRMAELMERMKQDNPADPVNFLMQAMMSESFAMDVSSSVASPKYPKQLADRPLSIAVLGASGDLAKKKTFPALFTLFRNGHLPECTSIVGYARSKLSKEDLRERLTPYLPKDVDHSKFFDILTYVDGPYDDVAGFKKLDEHLRDREQELGFKCGCSADDGKPGANRVFYLALPPTAFVDTCKGIKGGAMPQGGWTRIVVEKPFGHDTDSSLKLAEDLQRLFKEEQLYRIDHYLGKEMVQNLTTLRFANHVFGALWNNHHIKNVQITFKETIGTQGRGGYFDQFGIIRDVMQNHLTQILALVTMEKPRTLDGEHIRDEKVAALRCVRPVEVGDCVLGQYTAKPDGSVEGYLDDPTVPKGSRCPTFASMIMWVNNDRWDGVPFIMKAGKALDRKEVTIRIQFKDEILPFKEATQRNELVIRAQPDEAMYLKIATKAPGIGQDVTMTELDLTYKERFDDVRLPEAYESLINEVILGNTTNFVRSDELDAAWRIFTPLLHKIDAGELEPIPYPMGSRGPPAADELSARAGYVRTKAYEWRTTGTAEPRTPGVRLSKQ
eukprot:CAMPEP_0174846310 /NCGR_PEP_ID=MMETSP1114-20130205/12235_1 /TAXON_ID=312471 /ORGANISM="Neobodo designis, Strain CCAP 1951/1" /LENGTH=572 /DNA_ID=CAMNT_0016080573 /DNA_START=53 /DNA_END=1771 /DNA_ORIENTATION=-